MATHPEKRGLIVEFMGCTGAGKTPLAQGTVHRLRAQGVVVREGSHAGSSVLLTLENALGTPVWFLALLRDWSRCGPHLRATWSALRGRVASPFWTAARAYATIRLLGRHARYARAARGHVAVVDEGVLVTAPLAFCGNRPAPPQPLERFVAAAALPDVIVWVDAPLDVLVDRTLSRRDLPRELRSRPRDQVRTYLAQVRALFRTLAEAPRIAGRVISLWNPTAPPRDRYALAERAADAIRRRLDAWPA